MNRSVFILACLCFLVVGIASGDDAPSDPLEQAGQLLARKDYRGAIVILEKLVKDDPQNGRALLSLGNARRGLGQIDAAAAAYQQAYAIPRAAQPASQALFLLYAGASRDDAAFKWFEILHKTPGVDLSGLAENPEAGNLHGDPRFAALFPDRIAFEPPFLEDVHIIHEWRGEQAGDEFGWIARGIGDVDGDGITDVVISATGNPPYGKGAGKLYLYSGKSGKLIWKVEGKPGALLGTGLEAAGDVDGDGILDVVAGAPGENAVYVFSGKDGRLIWRLSGDSSDHDLGTSVSGIGDFDHDGVADIIAGAPSSEAHGAGTGRVYVFSGKTGKRLLTLDGGATGDNFGSAVAGGGGRYFIIGAAAAGKARHGKVYVYDRLSTTPKFEKEADATGAALGYMFLSVIGDVDHDGAPDIYATDFSNGAKGHGTGRAYVYSGKTGETLRVFTGDTAGEGFGIGAARVGDVDHDGHDDLIIGSWQYSGAAWSGGRVRVFSGKDSHVLQSFTGKVPGETLGFDAVGVGDVDGDGITDYLITSAWSSVNGLRSGRVYLVSGRHSLNAL